MKLHKGFYKLLSKVDKKTKQSFKTNAEFFIHINTSNSRIVERETTKMLDVDLYKIEGENCTHYLTDQSYILELHKIGGDQVYRELGKFCHKVSSIIKKTPTIVYSFEHLKMNDNLFILDEIKNLRTIISQLTKMYKQMPNFVLSIADIDKHPSYSTFMDNVAKYDIPLLLSLSNQVDINDNLTKKREQYISFADEFLLKKHPQDYLRFSYFINNVYDCFDALLNKLDFITDSADIKNILLYITNTNPVINQNFFQSAISNTHNYGSKLVKKIAVYLIIFISIGFGAVFTNNLFIYKKAIKSLDKQLDSSEDVLNNFRVLNNFTNISLSNIKQKLILGWVYPDVMLIPSIHKDIVAIEIQQRLIKLLESNYREKDSIYRTYLFLLLESPRDSDLKELILSNLTIWSKTLNIPQGIIKFYINSKVPSIQAKISKKDIANSNTLINFRVSHMIKTYITNNGTINLRTIHLFLKKIYFPVIQQQILNEYMVNVYPKNKPSLSRYNKIYLEELYKIIKSNHKSPIELESLESTIPSIDDTKVDNLLDALDLLKNLNKTLDDKLQNDPNKNLWSKIIVQATYNDLMNQLSLSQAKFVNSSIAEQSIVNIGDSSGYKGNISMLYTKIGIKEIILPEISEYKSILKLLEGYKINGTALSNYYNMATTSYIDDYKKSYINLISAYKQNLNPNDIVTSLLLISSPNSQFNNMLKALLENTYFSKGIIKDIPQLVIVNSYFNNVNKMIANINDIYEYNQIIKNIANTIVNSSDKNEAINEITLNLFTNSKNSYLYQVNSLLKKNNIGKKNAIIFTAPLMNIMEVGKPYLIEEKYALWKKDIVPYIQKYSQYYPFNRDSSDILTPEEFKKIFGPKGKFWGSVKRDMYGIFEYKKGKWVVKTADLLGKNTESMLDTLNSVQKLTNIFWDDSGREKPLKIIIHVEPISNQKLLDNSYIKMSLLNIGDNKVVGISSQQKPETIAYKWYTKQSSSVGYIDSNERIKSLEIHPGYWSLLMLLDQANQKNNIYTWEQNNLNIKFEIRFSNIFNTFKNLTTLENL
ncbi:hypothetical protein [Francisella salina]|uniref:IcmF-related protein n=1 Tax=Francisella salina TaxID=573569 RepID=A0ABN3ZPI9_FRAST|nr:hypothetical protein [Francisella salina]AEI36822.1 hypothetical protein F7308_1898 [Francisella salina]